MRRDDYDDEFEGQDRGRSLLGLLLSCAVLWSVVAIVTWVFL